MEINLDININSNIIYCISVLVYCLHNILVQFIYYFVAALQSVFPQTELGTFMIMSKKDKQQQLQELTNIVTGIRLFNRNSGKGGEGIDDR